MSKQLIMNCSAYENRVALLEDGSVCEFYIERTSEKSIVGNIYKGKVFRVLSGIQSCFVDVGLERSAFLYGGDIISGDSNTLPEEFEEDRGSRGSSDEASDENENAGSTKERRGDFKIHELVKDGQEILVQVAKDAISTKGARVTTYLSLPGRYVVLMPRIDHIGISRKISSEEERNRLRDIVNQVKKDDFGIIVRTASENVDEDKIIADINFLATLWENISQKCQTQPTPSLLHEDLNLVSRVTRDMISEDLERIVVDDKARYEELFQFLNRFSVKLGARVQYYNEDVQIFDMYGIDREVERAMGPRVWLKSGGYLVIERTEALTAIDVNTGRFVGGRSLNETILKTNLEAAREIVHQLRFRNLGGIIILDFIDMESAEDRHSVFSFLQTELRKDKAKTTVLQISEMGLVQMTRKRTEESLLQKISTACSYCEGRGHVKSPATIVYQIFRDLQRELGQRKNVGTIIVEAHPKVVNRMMDDDKSYLQGIEEHFQKKIQAKSNAVFHEEHYEIKF